MITRKEVEKIANLARIGLSSKEIDAYSKDLSAVLNYIGKLKKANVAKAGAASHSRKVINVFRKDEAVKEKEEVRGKLIQAASSKKDGYIKVKSVFK